MRQTTLILLECRPREGSAGPRVPLLWRHHATEIAAALSPLELVQVAGPDEAEAAAFDAAVLGFSRIVAVGGSPVAHGLVNGVMRLAEGHRRRMKIGFLSLGQRGPWARAVGLPGALDRKLEILAAGHTLLYDVGRLECRTDPDEAGRATVQRYFLLGAACGPLSAAWSLAAMPPLRAARMAGSLLEAGMRCVVGRAPHVALEIDGKEIFRGPWALGLVMGGRHYPLLGETAPQASPSDGSLDVAWIPAANLMGMTARAFGLWLGGQLSGGMPGLPSLPRGQGAEIRIVPLGEFSPQTVEADGVPAGFLPASVRVVPRTLPVIVEAVAARLRQKTRVAAAEMPAHALAGGLRAMNMGRVALDGPARKPLRARRHSLRRKPRPRNLQLLPSTSR